ncbi:hypothetical protein JCM30566_13710 [Marinitoga arctica]
MKIKILWISPFGIHDKVSHAGGQTFNYYFKKFYNDGKFEMSYIISNFYGENENLMEKEYSNAKNFSYKIEKSFFHKGKYFLKNRILRRIIMLKKSEFWITSFSIKDILIKSLHNAASDGYNPDIIILDWTQIVLLIDEVRRIFPNSKIIASEQDVSYLGFYRKIELYKKKYKFINIEKIYENFRKKEIETLNKVDLIVVYNKKDYDLLIENDELKDKKIKVITPYYNRYYFNKKIVKKDGILFFGAMSRMENFTAVEWFIKNVWKNIPEKLKENLKFYVVGSGISNKFINKYKNDKTIIFTGYIPDPSKYFERSVCMVVPLIYGAGIKIKVLEGMNAGLPVLTNHIGIEGIPAEHGVSYIHCERSEEYINGIIKLYNDTNLREKIGKNAKEFMMEKFDLNKSYENFKKNIIRLKK